MHEENILKPAHTKNHSNAPVEFAKALFELGMAIEDKESSLTGKAPDHGIAIKNLHRKIIDYIAPTTGEDIVSEDSSTANQWYTMRKNRIKTMLDAANSALSTLDTTIPGNPFPQATTIRIEIKNLINKADAYSKECLETASFLETEKQRRQTAAASEFGDIGHPGVQF